MKHTLFPLALALLTCACTSDELTEQPAPVQPAEQGVRAPEFPQSDGARTLTGTNAEVISKVLRSPDLTPQSVGLQLGNQDITPEHYKEIQARARELTEKDACDYDRMMTLYRWVHQHVKHGNADNDPWSVYQSGAGVCQGYANLLKVMLHSLDIPSLVVNGDYPPYGGHAWNYAYATDPTGAGAWYVLDPTNSTTAWLMTKTADYKHLVPEDLDAVFVQTDQYEIGVKDHRLNVMRVKQTDEDFVAPWSALGYQVFSFNPVEQLPATVRRVYLGKNIKFLGGDLIGLATYADNLEAVLVDEANALLANYGGAVYKTSGSGANRKFTQLYLVPRAAKELELYPQKVYEKNHLYGLPHLERLTFPAGTERIEAYAVESCPELREVVLPRACQVEADAFYGSHPQLKITYLEDLNGIPAVTM